MKLFISRFVIALLTFSIGFAASGIVSLLRPASTTQKLTVLARSHSAPASCTDERVQTLLHSMETDPGSPYLRYSLQTAYLERGCYDEASRSLEAAISIDPSNAYAYGSLGNIYDHLGRYQETVELLERYLKAHPDNAFAHIEIGYAYNELGRTADAIRSARRAIELDPEDAYAYAELSDSYLQLKRYTEAAAMARKAVALAVTDNDYAALNNAGTTLFELHQYQQAEDAFQRALRFNPDTAYARFQLAALFANQGRHEQTEASYQQLLACQSLSPGTYLMRGWAHLYWGDDEAAAMEARTYLQRSKWRGHNAPYAGLLGYFAYRMANRQGDAQAMLAETAANSDPSKWSYQIVQYLRQEITAQKLLARASDSEEMTEAHAYIGINLSLAGHHDEALAHLSWVKQNGNKDFSGYAFTISELSRLRRSAT